jgi:hypothetical protein
VALQRIDQDCMKARPVIGEELTSAHVFAPAREEWRGLGVAASRPLVGGGTTRRRARPLYAMARCPARSYDGVGDAWKLILISG